MSYELSESAWSAPKSRNRLDLFKMIPFRRVLAGIVTAVVLLAALVGITQYLGIGPFHLFPCCVSPTPTATSTVTPHPIPAPTLVQHNISQPGSTTPNTVAFLRPVTPGDLIVVAITQDASLVEGAPKDNHAGDTYASVLPGSAIFANPEDKADYVEMYYAKDAVGGVTNITVNFSAVTNPNYSGDSNVGVYEFSGLSKTSPLDIAASTTGGTQNGAADQSTTLSGIPLNTTVDNDICIAVGVDSGLDDSGDPEINTPATLGAGYYSLDQQDDSVDYERFYTEWAPIPQAHSPGCNPNFTLKYDSYWAILGAAFKP